MPSYAIQVNPSSIFIFASNPEDRSYTAVINFTWTHDSDGQAIQNRVSTTAGVQPHLNNGIIYQMSGAYVNVQVPGGFSVIFQ